MFEKYLESDLTSLLFVKFDVQIFIIVSCIRSRLIFKGFKVELGKVNWRYFWLVITTVQTDESQAILDSRFGPQWTLGPQNGLCISLSSRHSRVQFKFKIKFNCELFVKSVKL